MRHILLSFDVEEFDMPLEYNQPIALSEQLEIGRLGLEAIMPFLKDKNITATLFTTATYAIHFPDTIRQLATQHEIASHTYYHSEFENKHLLASKLKLEAITGKPVTGLRMPRMRKVEMSEVIKAGYAYDSSINPTWLPGRYNNRHLPRTKYIDDGMVRIPASVSPNLRIPLFWLAFKNFPYAAFKSLALQTLRKDSYICLYFHPWEFTDAIKETALPVYTKRWCGQQLVDRLGWLIKDLAKEGEFVSMQQWLEDGYL
ncbi:polysaccharide deacetylase family protein [Parasediminibacterium sp. JCM 36343]|uniref:polysaccharide deacetylase family protein n=1 Tax=Parasediminibacterium sp. JCM 36343 TaxID=3374279 RepID=UPI00397DE7B1